MSDENESEDVSEKRITLLAILEAFNAPIKFDQAWAIIYIVSLTNFYLTVTLRNDHFFTKNDKNRLSRHNIFSYLQSHQIWGNDVG